jgi:hypothetical protein
MLKIKNLMIALAFAPLIAFSWQLTNHAGMNSPSKGGAGSGSGGVIKPVPNNPSPSKGGAGSGSGGTTKPTPNNPSPSKGGAGSGSGGSKNPHDGSPSKGDAGSRSGSNSDVVIIKNSDGTVAISVPYTLAASLKNATIKISLKYRHGQVSKIHLNVLRASINNLNMEGDNSSATMKIADLDQAINNYNKIVLNSDPKTLQELAQNTDFVNIGKTLNTFREAIN